MKKLVLSISVVFALAGCGVSADNADSTQASEDVRLGARCGGGTLHAPVCNHGLVCTFAHNPPWPGESGTCQHAPACVQNVLCTTTSHWDRTLCRCVANDSAAGHVCIQNELCALTAHWDSQRCACVPNTGECDRASDCSGILPDFCRVCSSGHSECAHWTCTNHVCTIATCPN